MKNSRCMMTALCLIALFGVPSLAQSRVWTDSTGRYTIDAELVTFNDKSVVLERADHELVAFPIDKLSEADREFLTSKETAKAVEKNIGAMQTWVLRDGTQLMGRVVDYATADMTLQRRRGRIYVNDRVLDNLPEFYQKIIPRIVAQSERLRRNDRQSLEAWLVRQRGEPRTFHLDGVIFELGDGDEYAVPFSLLREDDLLLLKPGWDRWLASHRAKNYDDRENRAFLLRSLAAARQHDTLVQRQIATMQLKFDAVAAGVTSLWEVTIYPAAGRTGAPRWVVVPGRNSQQATETVLEQNPGYVAGPVRRIAG
jgi:hypothetical protein